MIIKGGKITEISHSPSGQVVAHVYSDSTGRQFLMPFGLPISLPDIIKRVEDELYSSDFVKQHAIHLNTLLVPEPQLLPWYRKTWMALSWYFWRSK